MQIGEKVNSYYMYHNIFQEIAIDICTSLLLCMIVR